MAYDDHLLLSTSTYTSAENLVCGVIAPGVSAKYLTTLNVFTLGAAQQDTYVVTRLPFVKQFPEHLDTGTSRLSRYPIPTISISSPTLTTPRSIRPVTTVPRPEIENTSSIGIRKAPSTLALAPEYKNPVLLASLHDRTFTQITSVTFQAFNALNQQ